MGDAYVGPVSTVKKIGRTTGATTGTISPGIVMAWMDGQKSAYLPGRGHSARNERDAELCCVHPNVGWLRYHQAGDGNADACMCHMVTCTVLSDADIQ